MDNHVLISVLFFFVCYVSAEVSSSIDTFPHGSVRNCPTMQLGNASNPLIRMDALPGFGFDILRSLDLGQVFTHSYSQCKMSGDGVYLIPDSVHLIPILNSNVQYMADVFDDMNQWKSEVAASMSAKAKATFEFGHISGKFSAEYQKARSRMTQTDTRLTRVGIRHHLYSIDINLDARLSPYFKSRIFEIAANIIANDRETTKHLSELLVRDYGTHVITSIDVGASLSQTTTLNKEFDSDTETVHQSASAAASAHFGALYKVSMNVDESGTSSSTSQFQSSSTNSYTTTHGGPLFKLGNDFTYSDWEDGILDHLVAIDRRGELLYSVLNIDNLPELTHETLMKVSESIDTAIQKYIMINTKPGCMNVSSENFDHTANVQGACDGTTLLNDYFFGGLYQECGPFSDPSYESQNVPFCNQVNVVTGDKTCPPGSEKTHLYRGEYATTQYTPYNEVVTFSYDVYWCPLTTNEASNSDKVIFGGIYSSTKFNEYTGSSTCPFMFRPQYFGTNMRICFYQGDDLMNIPRIKFGGFYSNCYNGSNPLAVNEEDYPTCPQGYSSELLTTDEICSVIYCIDRARYTKEYFELPGTTVTLPPFTDAFQSHGVNTFQKILQFIDTDGNRWKRNSTFVWTKAGDDTNKVVKMSYIELCGILVGVMIGTALVIIGILIGAKVIKHRKNRRNNKCDDYEPINS